MRENRTLLQSMNLLVLFAVFTPALGTIILVVTWLNLRNRVRGADELGKMILNYNITLYSFGFLLGGFYAFFLTLHIIEGQLIVSFLVAGIFLLTLVLVIINAFRIDSRKEINYKPAFKFIK
ncbi:MAG: DUF4870 domain-containing protein [Bacteroidota bacterium]